MKKKYILIGLTLIIIILAFIYGASLFSPGMYADSEEYELSINESETILLLENLKKANPKFYVPGYPMDERDNNDHLYHFYFYYDQENQIIHGCEGFPEKVSD